MVRAVDFSEVWREPDVHNSFSPRFAGRVLARTRFRAKTPSPKFGVKLLCIIRCCRGNTVGWDKRRATPPETIPNGCGGTALRLSHPTFSTLPSRHSHPVVGQQDPGSSNSFMLRPVPAHSSFIIPCVGVGQQHGRFSNSPLSPLVSPLATYTHQHGTGARREFQVKFLGHAAFSCCRTRSGNRPSATLLSPRNEEYGNAPQANCPALSNRCDARTLGRSIIGLIAFSLPNHSSHPAFSAVIFRVYGEDFALRKQLDRSLLHSPVLVHR